MADVTRRDFMASSAKVGAGVAVGLGVLGVSKSAWAGANDRVRVAVIGINGRGKDHIGGLINKENVEIAALCDTDERLFESRVKSITDKGKKAPKTVTDMRRIMDDPEIDVVTIATPNHWHSLAAIWACEAGKDVYVEKPCSHNVYEGRKLVEAAKKHGRVVQHGTQIRSSVGIREAVDKLREGVIGEVYMARGLCFKSRGDIGKKPNAPVPDGVNYDLWLGPAPEREFSENRHHYNWHWHWDYGNGDIGNQGVHQMDIARWGLGVGLPKQVSSTAHMVLWDDDKEVPNLIHTSFHYPDEGKIFDFDTRPWYTNDEKGAKIGVTFYGSEGYMVIDSYSHYKVYLGKNEEAGPERDAGGDHYANFIEAVRAGKPELLNAPIEEGHLSSALCHLGLVSARLGRSLEFDPVKEKFVGDKEANRYISREYRAPFVVA